MTDPRTDVAAAASAPAKGADQPRVKIFDTRSATANRAPAPP